MSLEECLNRIRSAPVPANEESAKFQIIGPILQHLGWDPRNPAEVLFEHGVSDRGSGRVDIALRHGNRLVALIEAKNPDADLKRHVPQMLSYAFHEGVDICVLTNGTEWWLFLPREKGEPMERRFKAMDLLQEPIEQLMEDLVAFLHKESLGNGEAERKAKLVLKANLEIEQLKKELPSIWQQMLDEPDEELVEVITKRVYADIDLRPTPDQISMLLNGRPMANQTPAPSPAKATAPSTSFKKTASSRGSSKRKPKSTAKPEAFSLFGIRHPFKNYRRMLLFVVEELHDRNPSKIADATKLGTEKFPYATTNPKVLSRHFRLKNTDYYVYWQLSSSAMQERAIRFLELYGFEEADLELIFAEL